MWRLVGLVRGRGGGSGGVRWGDLGIGVGELAWLHGGVVFPLLLFLGGEGSLVYEWVERVKWDQWKMNMIEWITLKLK